ncbi:hypothetical protein PV04_08354 [Phialophora macrospora]|uniref:Uncharacterized protein n=1 Tax=Phialophora macrospora TaxID=1851006 RepID=A0A0D2FDN3_9EURO|nr:hypothetical protein PV04_08354 [Phialophora macrospora]
MGAASASYLMVRPIGCRMVSAAELAAALCDFSQPQSLRPTLLSPLLSGSCCSPFTCVFPSLSSTECTLPSTVMSEDNNTQAPAAEDSANTAEDGQPALAQPGSANPDFNMLRTSVRESTARLQYMETGEWTTEDLENIETAEDLSTEQWNKIFRINKVLYGFTIRESESDIVKARQQAFVLQPPPSVQDPVLSGLPEFEVCDSSSISIKQIKTDLQRSLAENGFSAKSISTALLEFSEPGPAIELTGLKRWGSIWGHSRHLGESQGRKHTDKPGGQGQGRNGILRCLQFSSRKAVP